MPPTCFGLNMANLREVSNKGIKQMQILLTLYLLKWRIWWAPNNASKGQVGSNSAKDVHMRGQNTTFTIKLLQIFNMQTNYKHVSCNSFTFRVNIYLLLLTSVWTYDLHTERVTYLFSSVGDSTMVESDYSVIYQGTSIFRQHRDNSLRMKTTDW